MHRCLDRYHGSVSVGRGEVTLSHGTQEVDRKTGRGQGKCIYKDPLVTYSSTRLCFLKFTENAKTTPPTSDKAHSP